MKNSQELKQRLYRCDKCSDTGWIYKLRSDGSRYVVSCECRDKELLKLQWKKFGINIANSKQSFKSYELWNESSRKAQKTALAFYNNFMNIRLNRQNSIILCGQVGSGKTHLAIAIALNFISKNTKVIYMPYRDAIVELKRNIVSENYQNIIDKYKKCEVLLIDDLYKGKVSESDISIMFEIINYRYLNYLPMIITSEFTVEKMLEVDEGIGSRIYEMCRGYVVEVPRNKLTNYRIKDKEGLKV